jgi:ribosomal protein S18 acetylase RimI-like enzyme
MTEKKIFNPSNKPTTKEKGDIVTFLYDHLEEYGDARSDIGKAVDYALKESPSFGGFIMVSYDQSDITGVVVFNQTGMKGYIPENILVYIATHKDMRGQGIGKELMHDSIQYANGDIALHVEPDNPAKFLYEKIGFTNKYLEMRYRKDSDQN